VAEGRLVAAEDEAPAVRRILELRSTGLGKSAIADRVNAEGFRRSRVSDPSKDLWTRKAVEGVLAHCSAYRGDGISRTVLGEEFVFETPALVPAEVADAAAAHEARKLASAASKVKRPYPLRLRVFHDHEDGTDPYTTHGVRHARAPRPDGLVFRSYKCVAANKQRNSGVEAFCPGFGRTQNGRSRTTVIADRVEALVLFELANADLGEYAKRVLEVLNSEASALNAAELDRRAEVLADAGNASTPLGNGASSTKSHTSPGSKPSKPKRTT
jgi:hypothetical protein